MNHQFLTFLTTPFISLVLNQITTHKKYKSNAKTSQAGGGKYLKVQTSKQLRKFSIDGRAGPRIPCIIFLHCDASTKTAFVLRYVITDFWGDEDSTHACTCIREKTTPYTWTEDTGLDTY